MLLGIKKVKTNVFHKKRLIEFRRIHFENLQVDVGYLALKKVFNWTNMNPFMLQSCLCYSLALGLRESHLFKHSKAQFSFLLSRNKTLQGYCCASENVWYTVNNYTNVQCVVKYTYQITCQSERHTFVMEKSGCIHLNSVIQFSIINPGTIKFLWGPWCAAAWTIQHHLMKVFC